MNQDQFLTLFRMLLTLFGGYLVQRGFINNADLTTVSAALIGATGPVILAGNAIWNWYLHSHTGQIAAVNAHTAVTGVKVVDSRSSAQTVTAPQNGA